MSKRIVSFLMMFLTFISVSIVTFASEVDTDDRTSTAERSSTNAGFTVTDSQGNKFYIVGYCYPTANAAASYTSFSTSHYITGTAAGKAALDQKGKTISVNSTVSMLNGILGSSTTYNASVVLTGASNSKTYYSDTLLYQITNIWSTHSFSCNGGSKSGSSSYSLF